MDLLSLPRDQRFQEARRVIESRQIARSIEPLPANSMDFAAFDNRVDHQGDTYLVDLDQGLMIVVRGGVPSDFLRGGLAEVNARSAGFGAIYQVAPDGSEQANLWQAERGIRETGAQAVFESVLRVTPIGMATTLVSEGVEEGVQTLSQDVERLGQAANTARSLMDHWGQQHQQDSLAPFIGMVRGLGDEVLSAAADLGQLPSTLAALPETLSQLGEMVTEITPLIIQRAREDPGALLLDFTRIYYELIGSVTGISDIIHQGQEVAGAIANDRFGDVSRGVIGITVRVIELISLIGGIVALVRNAPGTISRLTRRLRQLKDRLEDLKLRYRHQPIPKESQGTTPTPSGSPTATAQTSETTPTVQPAQPTGAVQAESPSGSPVVQPAATQQPHPLPSGTVVQRIRDSFNNARAFHVFLRSVNARMFRRAALRARRRLRDTTPNWDRLRTIERRIDQIESSYPGKIRREEVRQEVARLIEEAHDISSRHWNSLRPKIWEELYDNNQRFLRLARRREADGDLRLPHPLPSGRAPEVRVLNPDTGVTEWRPLNIDHATPLTHNPFRATDPDNLRITTPEENSRALESVFRRRSGLPVSPDDDPIELWLLENGLTSTERRRILG